MKKDNWRKQTTCGHKKEAEEVKRKYEERISKENNVLRIAYVANF